MIFKKTKNVKRPLLKNIKLVIIEFNINSFKINHATHVFVHQNAFVLDVIVILVA